MGLLEQDIGELKQLIKQHQAGQLDHDHAVNMIAIMSHIEKKAQLMLETYELIASHSGGYVNHLMRSGLMDGDPGLVDPEMAASRKRDLSAELGEFSNLLAQFKTLVNV